ncbi:MAG TPA: energy transducer TonB [Vicinamibacteria bacterium]|nr:energy transducer TonB [Vicinamibacteria bacterium]
MAGRFFEQLLDSSWQGNRRAKRGLILPVSIAIHTVVLVAVVVLPLMSWGELPEPDPGAVRAFFVESAPVAPPPPPPPPPPAAPRAATRPRVERPKVKVETLTEAPRFTAPVEVPPRIDDPGVDIGGSDLGVAGGEPGGVAGGVAGGVQGGVIGGVVGGVLGGVPEPEATPPPPPPTQPPAPKGPVRVGGQIKEPTKVRNVPPAYPDIAKQARVQGVVVLEAVISPSGEVTNVRVMRGVPLLNDAATNAVRQWRYTPTMLNGQPVSLVMTVTVNFRLDD